MPTTLNSNVPQDEAQAAEALMNRLLTQLEQLRQALSAQPWQAPALKDISRTLEFACRTAFADKDLWAQLSRAGQASRPPALTVRPGGLERASQLLDRASLRLSQIAAE